ncbi:hypothetical protein LB505_006342 [Fusarium chuoi]|nr:hypothetical protein LB505_006342 [Fusarium chuoi]
MLLASVKWLPKLKFLNGWENRRIFLSLTSKAMPFIKRPLPVFVVTWRHLFPGLPWPLQSLEIAYPVVTGRFSPHRHLNTIECPTETVIARLPGVVIYQENALLNRESTLDQHLSLTERRLQCRTWLNTGTSAYRSPKLSVRRPFRRLHFLRINCSTHRKLWTSLCSS